MFASSLHNRTRTAAGAPPLAAAPPGGVDTSAHPVLPSRYVAVRLLCEMLVAEVMRNNPAAVAMAAELTQAVGSQLSDGSARSI